MPVVVVPVVKRLLASRRGRRALVAVALLLAMALFTLVAGVGLLLGGGASNDGADPMLTVGSAAADSTGKVSAAKQAYLATAEGELQWKVAVEENVPWEIMAATSLTFAEAGTEKLGNSYSLMGSEKSALILNEYEKITQIYAWELSQRMGVVSGIHPSEILDPADADLWVDVLLTGDELLDRRPLGDHLWTSSRRAFAELIVQRAIAVHNGQFGGGTLPEGAVVEILVSMGYPEIVAAGVVAGHQCAVESGLSLDVALLAGIIWVESRGEWESFADGPIASPSIYGVALRQRPLASSTTAEERSLYGPYPSGEYDHALGPMQFLAASWRTFGADCDGDGLANPQSIVDAAAGAANHLVKARNPDRTALATIDDETDAAGNYNPGDRVRYSADVMEQRQAVAAALASAGSVYGAGTWGGFSGVGGGVNGVPQVRWDQAFAFVGPQTDYSQCLGAQRPQDPVCTLGRTRFGSYPAQAAAAGVPRLFDCSGFVSSFYAGVGYRIPQSTAAMASNRAFMSAAVPFADIQPGDILLRRSGGGGHTALYVGDGVVIEANNTSPPDKDGVFATGGWAPAGLEGAYGWVIRPSLLDASFRDSSVAAAW